MYSKVIRNHMQKAVNYIKTLILIIISGVIIINGCTNVVNIGHHTIIDWVDFIKFNEITYLASHSQLGRDLIEDDLGESYSTVTFNVSNNVNETSYKSKNGDAAFLNEGTKIYQVKGYSPKFRLAALSENKIVLYEADTVPNANVGADYLDISGKVEYIAINEDVGDGNTELARIEKPDVVKELVDLLLTSPIKDDDNNGRNGTRYFLAFYLKDGTAIRHAYWHETGVFFRNILVPLEFKEIINSAI